MNDAHLVAFHDCLSSSVANNVSHNRCKYFIKLFIYCECSLATNFVLHLKPSSTPPSHNCMIFMIVLTTLDIMILMSPIPYTMHYHHWKLLCHLTSIGIETTLARLSQDTKHLNWQSTEHSLFVKSAETTMSRSLSWFVLTYLAINCNAFFYMIMRIFWFSVPSLQIVRASSNTLDLVHLST